MADHHDSVDVAPLRILFENADWTVTADGLAHGPTGYAIERGAIARRRSDGLWDWPMHVMEKAWVAPRSFADAFAAAVRLFELPNEGLAPSFAEAGIPGFALADAADEAAPRRPVPVPALDRQEFRDALLRRRTGNGRSGERRLPTAGERLRRHA